jgi:carboxymethylenebutenolidase
MVCQAHSNIMPPFVLGAILGGALALFLRPHVANVVRKHLVKKSWDLHLAGKQVEMEVLWDTHLMHEFSDMKDVALTLNTLTENPYVNHVPTLIGGGGSSGGKDELQYFYANHFHFANPRIDMTRISRTVGSHQIVDEIVLSLNHTDVIDWLAPGVAPTGRHVEFPLVAIVGFEENEKGDLKIAREQIYWDQATVLFQMGVLSSSSVCKIDISTLDITGIEQAKKVINPESIQSNELLKRKGSWLLKQNSPPINGPITVEGSAVEEENDVNGGKNERRQTEDKLLLSMASEVQSAHAKDKQEKWDAAKEEAAKKEEQEVKETPADKKTQEQFSRLGDKEL